MINWVTTHHILFLNVLLKSDSAIVIPAYIPRPRGGVIPHITPQMQGSIAAEVMGVTSARAMAQAGVGATLLPLQFVRGQNFDSNLSLYIVNNSPYSRQPVIVTRKGQFRTPYADYAINLLTGRE